MDDGVDWLLFRASPGSIERILSQRPYSEVSLDSDSSCFLDLRSEVGWESDSPVFEAEMIMESGAVFHMTYLKKDTGTEVLIQGWQQ